MDSGGQAGGLVIEGLVAGYGGGVVLDNLSLVVAPGESVALLGRNGVGKSTLLRTIMGLNQPKRGTISFGGMRIDKREPFEIARAGLGYVPQGREIFQELTVEENLLLGNLTAANADQIYSMFPALESKRRTQGGRLSGGQQQQLAIGRALMGKPKLLLLDEPSEGIQPSVVSEISATLLRIIRDSGMSLVLVEQNIEMALSLADRVDFFDSGRIVASHKVEALRANPVLIEEHMSL
ncbi:MAG: ABC transporter ATP-binding protein [Aestuariivirga sp.]|nr:ABC transporter ATP-binding protein [Aestuariivirga sp.]